MSIGQPADSGRSLMPDDQRQLSAARVAWNWRAPLTESSGDERRKMALRSAVGLSAATLFWLLHAHRAAALAAIAGCLSGGMAAFGPVRTLRWLDRTIETFAHMVGATVSVFVLTPIYFLCIVPLGLFFRRRPNALYQRQLDRVTPTYWTSPTGSQSPDHPY